MQSSEKWWLNRPMIRYQSMTEVIRDLEACQSSSLSGTSGAMISGIEDPDLQSFLSGLGGPSSNAPRDWPLRSLRGSG